MMRILCWMAAGVVIALMIGVAYFSLNPPLYEADMTIGIPLYEDLGESSGNIIDKILLPRAFRTATPQQERNRRFFVLISSTRVAEKLMNRLHPERVIFKNEWDAVTQTWHRPAGLFDRAAETIGPLLGIDTPWTKPDVVRLSQYIQHNVALDHIFGSENEEIRSWNADPVFAEAFVTSLVQAAQDVMREEAETHYRDEIVSLDAARAKTSDFVLQNDIASLKEQANQKLMLATAAQYGVSIIDGPQVFNERAVFTPFLILLLIGCSGAYIGLLGIMVRAGFVQRGGARTG